MNIFQRIGSLLCHLLFFGFLWWVLTEGSVSQLWFGGLVVILATQVSLQYSYRPKSPTLSRLKALLKFVPYFFFQSIKGGLIVARLACLPQDRLRPHYIDFKVSIAEQDTLARVCFGACLCVFPGSLSCGYRGNFLVIHVLDDKTLDLKAIQELEGLLDTIFSAAPKRVVL